jgi:hypothetical protein
MGAMVDFYVNSYEGTRELDTGHKDDPCVQVTFSHLRNGQTVRY